MKALEASPRAALALRPTPLEAMPRLAAKLGLGSLYVKRDDCTGLGGGGNKTRKLEFLVGEARAQGAQTLLTFGALQSNHARQTAAAAARAGLACHLVLVDLVRDREPAYTTSGNLLLDHLFGAEVTIVDSDAAAALATRRIIEAEQAGGRRVYVIPTGGSNAIGALGYVDCAFELSGQCDALDLALHTVVTAASTTGTLAGLAAGFAAQQREVRIVAVNVYEMDATKLERTFSERLAEITTHLGVEAASIGPVELRHDFLGAGYGIPSAAMREAVELTARAEGLLLDPVYTGKAMAGLIAMARAGELSAGTIFLHTGGVPALFAYREAMGPTS